MATETIVSNVSATVHDRVGPSVVDLILDHCRRVASAAAGFRIYRIKWLVPWIAYCLSPISRRLAGTTTARFGCFNVRLGECDLYTFANVFEDYPVPAIERAVDEVKVIVDLGANVGAFSCLAAAICKKRRLHRQITAIEPNKTNVAFLRQQPFAKLLSIRHAAVGPHNGTARLVAGHNSVSDHVDLSGRAAGELIEVLSLESLCDRPALVKMDIEGGEWGILKNGLPKNVRHLVMEWHQSGRPADLVPGNWIKVSSDIHGASMCN